MFSKKQFTTVTPLSKALAMIVFVILPFAAFFLGMSYGRQTLPPVTTEVATTSDIVETDEEESTQIKYCDNGGIDESGRNLIAVSGLLSINQNDSRFWGLGWLNAGAGPYTITDDTIFEGSNSFNNGDCVTLVVDTRIQFASSKNVIYAIHQEDVTRNPSDVAQELAFLRVVLPKGGETFCVGGPVTIRWEDAEDVDIVHVRLSAGNLTGGIGTYPGTFNDAQTPGVGEVIWEPSSNEKTSTGKIAISETAGGAGFQDKSEGLFSVIDCEG